MNSYISLKDYAKNMQIRKGGTVFISSDAKILLIDALRNKSSLNLNDFIDGLIDEIGPDGTLIFPTFNWGFCRGKGFDYNKTPCETGSLGTFALKRKDFKRTKHPIYSFAIYGKDQKYLVSLDNKDSFGIDSPFNYFKERNAVNYIIDVSLEHSLTFVHFVEEQSGVVKHRYIKNFVGEYVDNQGQKNIRTYSMFVRKLDMEVKTYINPIEEDFIAKGAGIRFSINNSSILKLDLGKAYPIIMKDILSNASRKLCSYKGQ